MQYQSKFQEAKASYDMLETFDIDGNIEQLDSALYRYSQLTDPSESDLLIVQSAFEPIGQYYSKLADINSKLQNFLNDASQDLVKLNTSHERYSERIHPEESTEAREIMFGLYPALRTEAVPYMLAISVFMGCLAIFMIFQMAGLSGQLNLPPALVAWWATPSVGGIPLYKTPMVLGGLILVLIVAVLVFAVLYFKKQH